MTAQPTGAWIPANTFASRLVLVSRLLPDGWTCHTLRHRCATRAYAATRDLRAVQDLLGHAKPETTARYTLVPVESVRAAMMAAAS